MEYATYVGLVDDLLMILGVWPQNLMARFQRKSETTHRAIIEVTSRQSKSMREAWSSDQ